MSNFISALVNPNRIIRRSMTIPATGSGTTQKSVVFADWPVFATLTSITVIATNSITNVTVKAVTNAAAYLGASSTVAPTYLCGAWSGGDANPVVIYDCADTYVEDATRVGFLHLILSAASITSGTVITVIVEGKATTPGLKVDEQQTPFLLDPTIRMMTYSSSTGLYTDRTRFLARRGNPWGNDAIDTSASVPILTTTTDYLYVGSKNTFTKIAFMIPSVFYEPTGTTLTAEYWNGSSWASATVQNNTSDNDNIAPSTFSYSGMITLTGTSGWTSQNFASDPLYIQTQAIINGTQVPTMLPPYYPMYWVRFKVTGGGFATLNAAGVMIVR